MVEVPVRGRRGLRARIRRHGAGWLVTTVPESSDLPIAGRVFTSLPELIWHAGHMVGASLELTDDHISQLYREAGLCP